jgi:hypothetical protein
MKSFSLILMLAALFAAFPTWAGQDRGGGNLEELARERASRKADLAFDKKFKTEVARYFEWVRYVFNEIRDPKIRDIFATMIGQGNENPAIDDVWNSEYFLSDEPCLNQCGQRVSASSEISGKATRICFDGKLLREQTPSNKELLALAVEEHVHHFGFHDEDPCNRPTDVMQWVADRAAQFYVSVHYMSDVGCEASYELTSGAKGITGIFLLGSASLGLSLMQQGGSESKAVGAIPIVAASAMAWNWVLKPASEAKRRKRAYEVLREAARPDPSLDGTRLGDMYKSVVRRSNYSGIQEKVTFQRFASILLEAEQRSQFCPLFSDPMTSSQVEQWVEKWIEEKAPL